MILSRRAVSLGLTAGILAACGGGDLASLPDAGPQPGMRPVPNPGYDAWLMAFRPRAASAGISDTTLDRALAGAGFLPGVIERDRNQTEFTRTLEDYLAIAASDERVADGRARYAQYGAILSQIEARFGVDAAIVTAIWGLESNFGTRRGDVPVISALSSLAYDARRGAFFESQLIAALEILQRGDVTPERMVGSWAGAMGHTQFIPTSYRAFAVDFDGDGRRDIWSDDPTDALASTASYLSRNGWRRGQSWGGEASQGGSGGRIVTPQPGGPAFRLFHNFDVIKRYNNSTSYAIGVGHLADRIAGGPPIRGGFPPDAAGMTISDRQSLQRRLTAAGFDTDGTDGVIGPDTRAAIRAYQAANGLPATGEPSLDLLARLS